METRELCPCKVKGGGRCGNKVLPGKNYCYAHRPKPVCKPKVTLVQKPVKVIASEYNGNYYDYLKTSEWKHKASAEKKSNPRCSLCNRKENLVVHHRTYKNIGFEKHGDLVVICEDCHKLFHSKYKYNNRSGQFEK